MTTQKLELPRLLLRIEEAAEVLGIGRSLMYALVLDGEVESVTVGRLRRIPSECLTEFIARRRAGNTPLAAPVDGHA